MQDNTDRNARESCIHCLEPLRAGARRCPSCQSWQSRWAADSQNPRIELAVVVAGVVFLATLAVIWALFADDKATPTETASFQQLEVRDVEILTKVYDTYEYVTVVGTVDNHSDSDLGNLFFYVQCLNPEGEVIDNFNGRDYPLVVPGGGSGRFKLVDRWPTQDLEAYDSCRVEVRWAKKTG